MGLLAVDLAARTSKLSQGIEARPGVIFAGYHDDVLCFDGQGLLIVDAAACHILAHMSDEMDNKRPHE